MIERFTRPRGRRKARGGPVRAPGLPAPLVGEVRPVEENLLKLGAEAGHALPGWADAKLGDAVAEAHASVRAAAGAIVPTRPSR
jgi:hypothetical protein